MELIIIMLIVASAIWVAADAKANEISSDGKPYGLNNGALAWFFTTALLWIVGFPMYLYKRSKKSAAPVRATAPAGKMKACPECAEQIQAAAVKCRYCQAVIPAGPPRPTPGAATGARPRPPGTGAGSVQ